MAQRLVSFEEVIRELKKRWKLMAIFVVLITGIAAYVNYYVLSPVYETTAKLFIGKNTNGEDTSYYDVSMYQRLVDTCGEILASKEVINAAIDNSKLDLTSSQVLNSLTIEPKENTQIIKLSYKSTDKEEGQRMLISIIEEFDLVVKGLIKDENMKVILKPQVPVNPIAPNKLVNIAFVFILSVMVSIGAVLVNYGLKESVHTNEEIEELLGVKILGTLPEYGEHVMSRENRIRRRRNKCYTMQENRKAVMQNASGQ